MHERRWKIGELAGQTGLTVRTLHHYDEIGLLEPSERSKAGHRLYSEPDVRRLYRVLALKELGLALHEIAGWLDDHEQDPRDSVRRQLDRLERQMELQQQLRRKLVALLRVFERREQPSADDLIKTMEVMMRVENYYTPDQLAQLEQRRKDLGEDAIRGAEREWADLIAEVKSHHERGTGPADPAVQALARRWNELIEAFTGGDPGIRRSLQKMYEKEGPQAASQGMVDPELMAYAQRINEAGQK
ncbi:MAG: MerR family transcriptional regulator [Actinomycetota bacterium]